MTWPPSQPGSSTKTDGRLLAVDVPVVRYSDCKSLEADLASQARDTVLVPFDSPNQLLLSEVGLTRGAGWRLSSLALRKICSLLAPGLASALLDLAGHRSLAPSEDRRYYSLGEAAAWFNAMLTRRFDRKLSRTTLVVDAKAKVVDAIVGSGYNRLVNTEFLQLVERSLARSYVGQCKRLGFRFALRIGRRLTVYSAVGPEATGFPDGSEYTGAVVITNSEVGDLSFRAAGAVVWSRSGQPDSACSAPPTEDHILRHSATFSVSAAGSIISRCASQPKQVLATDVASLAATPLGFGPAEPEDVMLKLTKRMARAGLPRSVARRVVLSALYAYGRPQTGPPSVETLWRREWVSRTELEVFHALQTEAARSPVALREKCEHLAYQMLAGEWRLTQHKG